MTAECSHMNKFPTPSHIFFWTFQIYLNHVMFYWLLMMCFVYLFYVIPLPPCRMLTLNIVLEQWTDLREDLERGKYNIAWHLLWVKPLQGLYAMRHYSSLVNIRNLSVLRETTVQASQPHLPIFGILGLRALFFPSSWINFTVEDFLKLWIQPLFPTLKTL